MHTKRNGVSTTAFATSVIVLVVVAAAGFGLYATKPQFTNTVTSTTTEKIIQPGTMIETMTRTANFTVTEEAIPFTPEKGQIIGNAWLLIEPPGTHGQFALSIYVPGLETTTGTGNVYIVEGEQMSGPKASVPVTGNATTSEFEVGSDGVGQFFVLLNRNPFTTFDNIQIFYLPGMRMSNATLVATASLRTPNM